MTYNKIVHQLVCISVVLMFFYGQEIIAENVVNTTREQRIHDGIDCVKKGLKEKCGVSKKTSKEKYCSLVDIAEDDKEKKWSIFEDMAIVEFLTNPETKLISDPVSMDKICSEQLVPRFLEAYTYANKQKGQNTVKDFAPLGSERITSSSWFIEKFHNYKGRHDLGHSDITRAAFISGWNHETETARSLRENFRTKICDCTISEDVIIFLAKSSQLPDLHRWKHDSYHAHTDEYSGKTIEEKERIVIASKKVTKEKIQIHIKAFKEKLKYGTKREIAEALIHLGVAFHIAQDLVYHHGMTLQQHSYLSYSMWKNPDFPKGADKTIKVKDKSGRFVVEFPAGSEASKRFNSAREITLKLLTKATVDIDQVDLRQLFTWKVAAETKSRDNYFQYEFPKRAKSILNKQDMELSSLTKYIAKSWPSKYSKEEYDRVLGDVNYPWNFNDFIEQLEL